MNPVRDRALFVEKACVAWHAINGVGGHDAPNMDAHDKSELMPHEHGGEPGAKPHGH